MKTLFAAAILVAASSLSAIAADLTATKAFAFETAPTAKAGAAYITVMTHGGDDRLLGAASPVAKRVEIHTHIKDGDVMRMRQVDGPLPVSAGAPIEMGPGGVHIMLMGLNAPLVDGQPIPVTLTFEVAGDVEFEVPVIERGAHAGNNAHSGHSGHSSASD